MNSIPTKRDKTLQFLLLEQERGLHFCWKIRRGFKKEVDLKRISRYSNWFFRNNLLPHFNVEEDFIFPLLKNNDSVLKKAMMDHRRLTRLFMDTSNVEKSLSLIEEELENYFRFEKQKLIQEIRNAVSEKEMDLIMKIYSESLSFEDWGDEFWK
jgi:hypothetical protein